MGHSYYYLNELGLAQNGYAFSKWRKADPDIQNYIILSTGNYFDEAIQHGYAPYGPELLCDIPYQPPTEAIEGLIKRHWSSLKDISVLTKDMEEQTNAITYKKSIRLWKLQRLYRWGYRKASRMAHNNMHNLETLNRFYLDFEVITKHDAQELSFDFKGIEFKIKGGANVEWNAHFIKHDGTKKPYKHFLPTPKCL
jgi:hypothetical protein